MVGLSLLSSVLTAMAPGSTSSPEAAVPATPPAPSPATPSYTAPVVGADALSFGILAIWILGEGESISDNFVPIGVVGALVAAPIIHLGHGHPKRAAASLGLRVGGVLAGAVTSQLVSRDCDGELCQVYWGVAGMIIGGAVASFVDIVYLTRGDLLARRPPPVTVAPMLTPTSVSLGVGGTW